MPDPPSVPTPDGDATAWLAAQTAPEDAGAQTQSRFRFQHECAARSCAAMLADGGVLTVVCEEHEDFVVFYAGDVVELVSVKHRDGSSGPWAFGALCRDGGVRHLYDRWLDTGRRARCRVMTNAGLKAGASDARAFVEACHTRDRSLIEPWAVRLAKQLDTADLDRACEFACELSVESGLPGREHIGAVNIRDVIVPALIALKMDVGLAEACYERVLQAIAVANRDAIGDRMNLLAVIADPARFDQSASTDRRLSRRTIDRAGMFATLYPPPEQGQNLAAPEILGAAPAPPSRLQQKLRGGGLGPTVIDSAVRLRASWYGFESARRTSVPGGDPAFDDLRIRVQELVALSESRVKANGEYGRAMHLDVRDTVTAAALAAPAPFPLDDQLLQGLVFQLTDECRVWWSEPFDLDGP